MVCYSRLMRHESMNTLVLSASHLFVISDILLSDKCFDSIILGLSSIHAQPFGLHPKCPMVPRVRLPIGSVSA